MNLSKLTTNVYDFSSNKIYIKDGQLKVGSPDSDSIHDLPRVTKKVNELLQIKHLLPTSEKEKSKLMENLSLINFKITKRNQKIDRSFILSRIDKILQFLTEGTYGLKVNKVEIPNALRTSSSSTQIPKAINSSMIEEDQNGVRADQTSSDSITPGNIAQEQVDHLFAHGIVNSINKLTCGSLIFEPDYDWSSPSLISRELRAQIAATVVLLAPKQPEGRSFEYVGFGSGGMRQDLHQVMLLIDQGITDIHISLIDPRYDEERNSGILGDDHRDFTLLLKEFNEIIKLKAPNVNFKVELFGSTDRWLANHEDSKIDLLTGVRVETSHQGISADIRKLEEKLEPHNSGKFISNAKDNSQTTLLIKDGKEDSGKGNLVLGNPNTKNELFLTKIYLTPGLPVSQHVEGLKEQIASLRKNWAHAKN